MLPIVSVRRALLVAFAALPFAAAQAPPEMIEKIVEEGGPGKSRVMGTLAHLVDDIGPRLTGSQRLNTACEWARDTFRAYGLDARLVQWGEIETGFDRGTHKGFTYSGADDLKGAKVVFETDAWTAGTDGMRRGRALQAPKTADQLAEFAKTVQGAWIVVRGGRDVKRKDVTALAKEHGALGVVVNGGELFQTSGNHKTKWDTRPTLPVVKMLSAEFAKLNERLDAGEAVDLGFDIQNHFRKGPIPVYNVIGELKGTEKPDEMVIVGGHLDSWDGATGTTDNGTGATTTIEAARILTTVGAKPKRTIRFMLWSGEEEGLLGSLAYIKAHPEENDRISCVLVHDGGTNYVSGIAGTAEMIEPLTKVFEPVFALDREMPFKIRKIGGFGVIGSDHDSYNFSGVPGFFWDQAGRANYMHTHHTQYDTYDAAIPEYQRHTATVVAIGALGVANLPELIPRAKKGAAAPNAALGKRKLGVMLDEETMALNEIIEGGRAAKAGLLEGDRIVKIDGLAIKSREDLANALNAGDSVKAVVFIRGGQERTITIDFTTPKAE